MFISTDNWGSRFPSLRALLHRDSVFSYFKNMFITPIYSFCMCHSARVEAGGQQLAWTDALLPHVGPRDGTQVVRCGSKAVSCWAEPRPPLAAIAFKQGRTEVHGELLGLGARRRATVDSPFIRYDSYTHQRVTSARRAVFQCVLPQAFFSIGDVFSFRANVSPPRSTPSKLSAIQISFYLSWAAISTVTPSTSKANFITFSYL